MKPDRPKNHPKRPPKNVKWRGKDVELEHGGGGRSYKAEAKRRNK